MMKQPFHIVFPSAYAVELQPQGALPIPGEDEFLFETRYTLISPGTELALYTGTHIGLSDPNNGWAKYPFSPGYAAVGRILSQGARDLETDSNRLYFAPAPHAAHSCLQAGPETFLLVVPEDLAPTHAPFCRLAAIAATALAVAPVSRGERVAVLGAGLIGNLAAPQNHRRQFVGHEFQGRRRCRSCPANSARDELLY